MAKPCPICNHPDKEYIESELYDGGPGNSFQDICNRYRLTSAKLLIHKEQHMAECAEKLVKLVSEEYDKKMKEKGVEKALTSIEVLDLIIAKAPELLEKASVKDVLTAVKLKAELLGDITQKQEIKLDWLKDIPEVTKVDNTQERL